MGPWDCETEEEEEGERWSEKERERERERELYNTCFTFYSINANVNTLQKSKVALQLSMHSILQ